MVKTNIWIKDMKEKKRKLKMEAKHECKKEYAMYVHKRRYAQKKERMEKEQIEWKRKKKELYQVRKDESR